MDIRQMKYFSATADTSVQSINQSICWKDTITLLNLRLCHLWLLLQR